MAIPHHKRFIQFDDFLFNSTDPLSALPSTSNLGGGWPHLPQFRDPAMSMGSSFYVGAFLHPIFCNVLRVHTGNSAFLRPPPALSSACCMYGPTTGMFPANPPTVEKKSPKSTNIPYNSIRKPTKGHRSRMSIIPAANAVVPFNF